MSGHIVDGEFQSDKYPTCPRGKVPLSVKDPTAQDLLWEYAQRRRVVDAEFSADLEEALRSADYMPECLPPQTTDVNRLDWLEGDTSELEWVRGRVNNEDVTVREAIDFFMAIRPARKS